MAETDAIASLLNEFGMKLVNFEERLKLLSDKLNAINNSFILHQERVEESLNKIKQEIDKIKDKLNVISERVDYLLNEMPSLLRREEIKHIERFIELWQPVQFARLSDVEEIVEKKLKQLKQNN